MTTNYDTVFEHLANGHIRLRSAAVVREQRYSLFRHFPIDGRYFWHLHGDVTAPRAIMLGYDHYAGALQKIGEYTTSRPAYRGFRPPPLIGRLSPDMPLYSWVDLFFTTDVHILGLALDTVEMHLWWILSYRARMLADGRDITGTIRYYHPRQTGIREHRAEERKLEMLEAFGVRMVRVAINPGQWEDFYRVAVARIRRHVRGANPG